MSSFKGFAELQVPHDLVRKLEYDLERIRKSPQDQYADLISLLPQNISWTGFTPLMNRLENNFVQVPHCLRSLRISQMA